MSQPFDRQSLDLSFYQDLAERVLHEQQPLDQAEGMAAAHVSAVDSSLSRLMWLAEEAVQTARRSPRRGYILAALAHAAARAADDEAACMHCELALAEISNRLGLWEEARDHYIFAQRMCARRREAALAARCQLGLATINHHLNHNLEARELCGAARDVFHAQDISAGVAECELLLAGIERTQGQYNEASQWARQARERFAEGGDEVDIARCDVELAYIAVCQQCYDEANALLQDTDVRFDRAGAEVETAWGYRIQALVYLDRGENRRALEVLSAAAETYRAQHMYAALRNCERNIANAYRQLGQCDEALAIYFRLRHDFVDMGMAIDVANCDMNIALTYKAQSRYAEALPFFHQAAEVCLGAGLTLHAARCQANMAQVEELLGAYDRALEAHQRSREIFSSSGMAVNVAHCEENMARIFLVIGDYDRALSLLRHAERVFQEAGAAVLVAANQALQAQAEIAFGRLDSARDLLDRAQATYAAEHMRGHEALCLLRLADLEQEGQAPASAARLYGQARQQLLEHGWTFNVAVCELGLGEACLAQDQVDTALGWFAAALRVLDPDFPDWAWRAYDGLSRCSQRSGDMSRALDGSLRAVDAIRRGRSGFHTARGSSAFFAHRQHVYNRCLELSLQVGALNRAVEIVEQSKAQTYLMLLYGPARGLRPKQSDRLTDNLLAQEQSARARLDALQNQLAFPSPADATAPGPQLAHADLIEQLASARRRHEEIVDRLFRTRPFWSPVAHPPPFELGAFRAAAAKSWGSRWGALAYYLVGRQLTILYVDSASVGSWTRTMTPVEERLLHICTSSDEVRSRSVYQDTSADHRTLEGAKFRRQLYALLIPEEVRQCLAPDRLLVVAPHGLLHGLPFHALQHADDSYLAQQATVVYAPSLHICQLLLERPLAPRAADDAPTALVIGVSEFGERALQLAIPPLEGQAIHHLLGVRSSLRLNGEATRASLLELSASGALRAYRILHFATHTWFDEYAPLESRLMLYDSDLTVPDLFDLALDAELVTLSSCESARGDINIGDEMIGFAQALFHAGARALVVGLWKVTDEATGALMTLFYHAIGAGQPPAAALATAQRRMIAAGYPPFSWAPFIVLGHPGIDISHKREEPPGNGGASSVPQRVRQRATSARVRR